MSWWPAARRNAQSSWIGARRAVTGHPRLAGGAAIMLLVAAFAGVTAWRHNNAAAAPNPVPVAWQRHVVARDQLPAVTGVKLVRVVLSGDGGLLDLRYQVIDPDRANSIHDELTPPAVVDEDTGLVVHSLLMGHAHTGDLKAAVTYYLVFENTGGWIHRGSKVSILLGDAQVEHVVVD